MRAAWFVLIAALAAPAWARIPSAASGVYVGSDRTCDVILKRYTGLWDGVLVTWWTQVEFDCRMLAGERTRSLTTLYAPGDPCQGVDQVAWHLAPYRPGGGFVRLLAWSGTSLTVVLGTDQNAVTNGIGRVETWTLAIPLVSPKPYACAAPAPGK